VAKIDGQPVTAGALAAHEKATGLSRGEALEDLVDLTLLAKAARAAGIGVPAPLGNEARAVVELEMAKKLGFDIPPPRETLIVDHAWVKNTNKKKEDAKQRASIDKLRTLVEAGATIPAVWPELKLKGDNWHIGDHEEYPADVVPAAAGSLQPGGLSPVIPGDGGLHLFKVYSRKQAPPPTDVLRPALRDRLREGKTIELVEAPAAP
jgi:hypothetical protein